MNTIKFTSKTTCKLMALTIKAMQLATYLTHLASKKYILVKMKMVMTNTKKVNHTGLTSKV